MALKLSTGLRNFLMGEGCLRKAFEDAVLNMYSGSAPTDADAAVTGTLLAQITKSSGTVTSGERSTPKRYSVTISSHAAAETFKLNITVDGVGPTTYTYTNTPDAGGVDDVAKGVARMLNDVPQLRVIAAGAGGLLYVQSAIDGLDFTLADGSGTGTLVVSAAIEASSRADTIQLGAPSSGVISKSADIWSGVAIANGTAGYFRLLVSNDDGTLSTMAVRMQGNISTSGAELNLSNLNIVTGATQTIDSFALTEPVS